jgi:hypothetical protein
MQHHSDTISSQQQLGSSSVVVSAAAVRLLLELQLLTAGAVQRQRQHQVQQLLQQQPASTSRRRNITSMLFVNCRKLLALVIQALAASSRSCLPPEVLQQAGLQLLQALAAPLQQLQLSAPGDSFDDYAISAEAWSGFSKALYVLVTAACGAEQPEGEHGEHVQHGSVFSGKHITITRNLMCPSTSWAIYV